MLMPAVSFIISNLQEKVVVVVIIFLQNVVVDVHVNFFCFGRQIGTQMSWIRHASIHLRFLNSNDSIAHFLISNRSQPSEMLRILAKNLRIATTLHLEIPFICILTARGSWESNPRKSLTSLNALQRELSFILVQLLVDEFLIENVYLQSKPTLFVRQQVTMQKQAGMTKKESILELSSIEQIKQLDGYRILY